MGPVMQAGNAVIEQVAHIVEQACAGEANAYGYGIWTHHITHVVRNARRLAPLLGADEETVVLAALLHDYAAIKDRALTAEHHIHGAAEAGRILQGLGCPPERIAAVQACIRAHRSSVPLARTSPEERCVAAADALTHVEQVPSLLHVAYVELELGIDEGAAWVRAKLERDWHKLPPEVQELARARYEAALVTLSGPAGTATQ